MLSPPRATVIHCSHLTFPCFKMRGGLSAGHSWLRHWLSLLAMTVTLTTSASPAEPMPGRLVFRTPQGKWGNKADLLRAAQGAPGALTWVGTCRYAPSGGPRALPPCSRLTLGSHLPSEPQCPHPATVGVCGPETTEKRKRDSQPLWARVWRQQPSRAGLHRAASGVPALLTRLPHSPPLPKATLQGLP